MVAVDYSLYLVTSRDLLPPGKDFYECLEEAIKGGVTIVQLREKEIDTGEFYEIAVKTKQITDKHNIPLIINDRLDICLAINASGLHIGQSDLPFPLARSLLPTGAILGVSVSNIEEAKEVRDKGGVDYVGVGAVWETGSKDVSKKKKLGPMGVGEVLDIIAEAKTSQGGKVESVAIGGIHLPNLPFLLHASLSPTYLSSLSGIAVISDIISSPDPRLAASRLKACIEEYRQIRQSPRAGHSVWGRGLPAEKTDIWLDGVVALMKLVREMKPLAHQITNTVVANDSANATLALGGSPIMATHPRDVKDLSEKIDALLVNFGTISDKEGMIVAGQSANLNKKPIIFDPVAVGATAYRQETAKQLLDSWQPTVIKGNAGEIGALAGSLEVASRGVDSVGPGFSDPVDVVVKLARKQRAIVVMTGVDDYISDGETVIKVSNGHELMGLITGSGCMTGTALTVFCGAARHIRHLASTPPSQLITGNSLLGVLAGLLVYTIAGEKAGVRADVKGPNTFRAAFIDEMYNLKEEDVRKMARFEVLARK